MEQRRAIIMHFVTSHPQCSLSLLHVLLYSIKPFDAVVDGVSIWIAIGSFAMPSRCIHKLLRLHLIGPETSIAVPSSTA
jgi:hypothetical protein